MQEKGYYWVKMKETEQWIIARYYPQSEDWCVIGMEESYYDKEWEQIGPRIPEYTGK